jgi:para-nitrobenzyl esterase
VDKAGGWNERTALLQTVFFNANRDSVFNALKSQQNNVWFYQFKWSQQPQPWKDIHGAKHGGDVPFLFGNFGPSLFANATNTTANEPGRLALSAAMMNTISAFMRTGDPNNTSLGVTLPPWPAQLSLDATLTQAVIGVQ